MGEYHCAAMPGAGIEAIVRLLADPPVEVRWASCVHKLDVVSNPHPPYPPHGMIVLYIDGRDHFSDHYHSGGHAYHVIMTGYLIQVPSVHATLFARLVREGRAAYVWGPHCHLHWMPPLPKGVPFMVADAQYTYRCADNPADDVAPILRRYATS